MLQLMRKLLKRRCKGTVFKKTIMFITALAILTACSDKEAPANNEEASGKTQGNLQTQEEQSEVKETEQQAEYIESSSEENVNSIEWASLPEYSKIIEQIGDKDYNFETVTDNDGKRVLYIIDGNGEKQYKTVFIKSTSHLKIININGNGLVFNGDLHL